MVSNKGAIMATTYNILREDKGIAFGRSSFIISSIQMHTAAFMGGDLQCVLSIAPTDLELYNEALKVIHDFPQHYPFEVAASG